MAQERIRFINLYRTHGRSAGEISWPRYCIRAPCWDTDMVLSLHLLLDLSDLDFSGEEVDANDSIPGRDVQHTESMGPPGYPLYNRGLR